ncbi:MAG: dTDP-4-dehydrorhamnose reductase [Silvibacterium sp.]
MKRVLILGAQGQLGIELQSAFHDAGHIIAHGRATCDLSDPSSICAAVREARPDLILNAAAYTAVDRAESEPELAMQINGEAPGILAEEAKKNNALLIHYSTDYVFDGSKHDPWVEDDPVHPLNVYGATKLAGERNIQQSGCQFLIFRTSWVFSPHGHNFLRTMLRLGQERKELNVVNDQKGAPTSALALATATRRIVDTVDERGIKHVTGTYHMTCAGQTTWFGFAQSIFQKAQADKSWASIAGIPASEYPTPAMRPANSVLSNKKLTAAFEFELPSWEIALDAALQALDAHRQ